MSSTAMAPRRWVRKVAPAIRRYGIGSRTYLRQNGLDATPDDILMTGGTQQTISLVAATLLQPGDRVITEVPTWPGALEVFEAAGARVIGIPLERGGMQHDRLVDALEHEQPRLIYTVPTFQNPTGAVMSARRRRALCALAEQYGVPILEDDHVREVRFGQPIPPPLAAFDRRGDVIHAGGFTKSLIPSLRIGYVVARGPLREALIARKRTVDLFGSALMQRALTTFLESGAVARHWRRVSRIYHRRHAVMLRALERHFPSGSQVERRLWRPGALGARAGGGLRCRAARRRGRGRRRVCARSGLLPRARGSTLSAAELRRGGRSGDRARHRRSRPPRPGARRRGGLDPARPHTTGGAPPASASSRIHSLIGNRGGNPPRRGKACPHACT